MTYGLARIDLDDGRAIFSFPAKHGHEFVVADPTGRWQPGVWDSEAAARASLSLTPEERHALQAMANRKAGAKVISLSDISALPEIIHEAHAARPMWSPV
ncbi:hypothetical protein M446_1155 [Methylobacterium sp. 4-46]|uniref:hypothetical protein n=1 Tax=unclassified Methylobacterium TaxID=2615210 RepID=UPI000152DB57|nr:MULTISPECIES: hypothetical protein [Methylobacterium]ACA15681.1 hypothetical protein M446_1155 [Methylobacterium sp. 4-46]WFT81393.1 hypothetical protein QA634_05745 [Methylobacterium nodulans]